MQRKYVYYGCFQFHSILKGSQRHVSNWKLFQSVFAAFLRGTPISDFYSIPSEVLAGMFLIASLFTLWLISGSFIYGFN